MGKWSLKPDACVSSNGAFLSKTKALGRFLAPGAISGARKICNELGRTLSFDAPNCRPRDTMNWSSRFIVLAVPPPKKKVPVSGVANSAQDKLKSTGVRPRYARRVGTF